MGADRNPDIAQAHPQSEMDALLLGRTKELMDTGPDARNWRGIAISFLVIVVVCSLILMAIVLLSPVPATVKRKARFSLKDIASSTFVPRDFNGTWISDEEFIFRNSDGALVLYNANAQNQTVIMPDLLFRQYNVDSYSLSSDSRYLLLLYNLPQTSTDSFLLSEHKVYDRKADEVLPLLLQQPLDPIQHVEWGPTGSQMIYISRDDIYYVPGFHGIPIQLTQSGSLGIQNGLTNWIYRERIFRDNKALWWSENGRLLCYLAFDDRQVNTTSLMWYGAGDLTSDATLQVLHLSYPKPGTPISNVSLRVVDLQKTEEPPFEVVAPWNFSENRNHYVTSVSWLDDNRLAVGWATRDQKYSVLSICDQKTMWMCEKHIEETSQDWSWVDFMARPVFAKDKKSYFLPLPSIDADYGNYSHVAMVDLNKNKTFLTEGPFDVVQILAHHQHSRLLYYISTLPGEPGQRHLFSVGDLYSANPRVISCLTCHLAPNCQYNDAIFSPGLKFFVLKCLGPRVPKIELWSLQQGRSLLLLDGNEDVDRRLQKKTLPQTQTFLVPLGGGLEAPVRLYLPPALDKEEITKYPMVLYLDCNPGSQLITEQFQLHWGTYLGSKKHYIYVMADTRGSGYHGEEWLHQAQGTLGFTSVQDQITIVRYLLHQLPFVDSSRIAVWGWGYGAHVALTSLAVLESPFCCGIAVAPIVSWQHYDAVFTERYLGVPTPDDPYGQKEFIKRIKNFTDKKLLIIHGTSDRHVHLQHSMFLIKALVDAGIVHRSQIYPDEDHNLTNVRYHLYRTMDTFLDQCFLVEEEPVVTGLQKFKILISG